MPRGTTHRPQASSGFLGQEIMHRSNTVSSGRCAVSRSTACGALLLLVSACTQTFQPLGREVPGPAGSIAAAPLERAQIAVLAGTERAKAVYVIDGVSGTIVRSFGVTKEATGIAAARPDGPLLLTVGTQSDGRDVGALERWSLDGVKQAVVPLPGAGLGITAVDGRSAYVLVGGSGASRAAVRVDVPTLRLQNVIALNAGASSLAECNSHAGSFLVYGDERMGGVEVRDLHSNGTALARLPGEGLTCLRGSDLVYAVTGNIFARRIAVLRLPAMAEVGSMPASRNARALYASPASRLIALNATTGVSTIETYDRSWDEITTALRDEPVPAR